MSLPLDKITEASWFAWREDSLGNLFVDAYPTAIGAKRAYRKIAALPADETVTYGFAYANDAEPRIRRQVGMVAFPVETIPLF